MLVESSRTTPLPSAVCGVCHVAFRADETAVVATQINKAYHPDCFTCIKCKGELVDLTYYAHKSDIYCPRCHAEIFVPRSVRVDA